MTLMRPEVWNDDAVAPVIADRVYGLLPTTTPAAPTTGSTIATNDGATVPTPIASARLNPAGAITGSILQAGIYDGQRFEARNISANTITMATAATSNVADGASAVLVARTAYVFVWDLTLARWMHGGL